MARKSLDTVHLNDCTIHKNILTVYIFVLLTTDLMYIPLVGLVVEHLPLVIGVLVHLANTHTTVTTGLPG